MWRFFLIQSYKQRRRTGPRQPSLGAAAWACRAHDRFHPLCAEPSAMSGGLMSFARSV